VVNRRKEIKEKGFSLALDTDVQDINSGSFSAIDFSKIKVGIKTLEDAVINIGDYSRVNPRLGNKDEVLRAINNNDLAALREISNFFYRTSGIYQRLCRYMAYLYRYDWHLTPYVISDAVSKEKIVEGFNKAIYYLDRFEAKRNFGEISLKVLRNGAYYGYVIRQTDRATLQELDPRYCRSRMEINNRPVVEFNMKYFDDMFRDTTQRMKILNLFPQDFKRGYKLFKENKLQPLFLGDSAGWYVLDPECAVKFAMNGSDAPAFASVIPAIIDLNEAQGLDRKKMKQKLLKIIIQKMPMDKNGDLIFDVDEARELHNNAVRMLQKAIGVDVLTTFADVDVADMADKGTTTTVDELAKVERTVYNEAGVSQMQFNTDGNIALEKSIANDEASMYNLVAQYEAFMNDLIEIFNKNPKKIFYKVQILSTTIYNYKELAKLYKEQTQLGYSKMLPQIALGQSQSSILATAHFENEVLELVKVFVPPMSSNTMSGKNPAGGGNGDNKNPKVVPGEEKKAGRKEKEDDQKSEKTIANRESMN
jgi:hypothetical protein